MRSFPVSKTMVACWTGLFLTISVGLFVTACYCLAQQPEPPKAATLPDGLRHVPPDAMGFIHIRAGDFLRSELGKQLLKEVQQDKEAQKGLQNIERQIEQQLGVALADLDTVTLVVLGPPTLAQIRGMDMRMRFMPQRMFRDDGRMDRRFMDKDVPFKDGMKKDFFPKDAIKDKFDDKITLDKFELNARAEEEHLVAFQPGFDRGFDPRFDDIDGLQEASARYLAMSGPLMIVTSTKALDRKKVLKSTLFQPNHGHDHGHFQDMRFDKSVLFLSDRSIMTGVPWEIERYTELIARKSGPKFTPMKSALAMGSQSHMVIAGGHIPAELRQGQLLRGMPHDFLRVLAPVAPLMQAEAGIALDLGKNIDLTLQFNAANEASAEQVLQAVKNLRVLAELAMEKTAEEGGEAGGWKLVLEKRMKQALADAVIEQKGLTVKASLKMELDPVLVKRYTKELVANVRLKADRTQSMNNLKQIALAMHSYHDANKRLPPAGLSSINDPTGKPLLSWRVAILPYVDQGPLYQQFDLTQPWDHPTNKRLIARMPHIYMVPGTENKDGLTHYRVLVGPQSAFEAGQRITLVGMTDGTSNTIMVVEGRESTEWTRPDDLPFDPKGPLPKFGITPDGFLAAMGDGTVRFIPPSYPENQLRALITRNGGETVNLPD